MIDKEYGEMEWSNPSGDGGTFVFKDDNNKYTIIDIHPHGGEETVIREGMESRMQAIQIASRLT